MFPLPSLTDEDPMSPNVAEKLQKPRFQFRLRRLFLITTLFAIILAWASSEWHREQAWRQAIAPVRIAGGSVAWFAGTSRKAENAISITLSNSAITDNDLATLQRFPRVEYLSLKNTRITDDGLEHLKSITSLTDIDLRGSKVTSSGITDLMIALPNTDISY